MSVIDLPAPRSAVLPGARWSSSSVSLAVRRRR